MLVLGFICWFALVFEFKFHLNSNRFELFRNRKELEKIKPPGPKPAQAQLLPAHSSLPSPGPLASSPTHSHPQPSQPRSACSTCARWPSALSRTRPARPAPHARASPAPRPPARSPPLRWHRGPTRRRLPPQPPQAPAPADSLGPPASSVSPASPGRATARRDPRPGDLDGLPIRARTPRQPAALQIGAPCPLLLPFHRREP